MSKTLYLECSAGISGDMTVAALLDLGADKKVLEDALNSISAEGFSVEIRRVKKAGIDCCDFAVHLDAEHENHDSDMEYLHRHERGHAHEHSHGGETCGCGHSHIHEHSHGGETRGCGHSHIHEHSHEEGGHNHGHSHGHEHRGMKEIREIIAAVKMTDHARELAERIFEIIAGAEAKAHGILADQVHFHEVGAVDSIVDVIAAAVCLDNLQVENVIVPKICEGTGTVRCQHGILPIPVPAVVNIAEKFCLNLEIINVQGEFVTPTGAAIAAAVKTADCLPGAFRIEKTGIGAGKRTYERPSILRAMFITPVRKEEDEESIYRLETNIDDCSGEELGYVMELLLEEGARDVHYHPVFMKKNRPAWQLNVICMEEDISRLEKIIFRETTTIGIRRLRMERTILNRESREVETLWGTAKVKICRLENENRYYPEYESVRKMSRESGRPFREIYREIVSRCK